MAPRADDSSDKRSRILDAAFRVCERRGIDGARMEEVAALAHVSKGTLYRFFESKEDLFLATIIESYERHLPLFDAGAEVSEDPRERLGALLDAMVEIFEAVSPRMPVHYQAWGLVAKQPDFEERLYGFLRRFHLERGVTLEETLADGRRRGVFRADLEIAAVADAVQALLSGFLYRATFDPENTRPDRLRRAFDAVLRDVVADRDASDG